MSYFEIFMLICFGLGWPFSIAKSLRTGIVDGKSPMFMAVIAIGYMCGIAHKHLYHPDWVTALYAINLLMVLFDLGLYFYYSRPHAKCSWNNRQAV